MARPESPAAAPRPAGVESIELPGVRSGSGSAARIRP